MDDELRELADGKNGLWFLDSRFLTKRGIWGNFFELPCLSWWSSWGPVCPASSFKWWQPETEKGAAFLLLLGCLEIISGTTLKLLTFLKEYEKYLGQMPVGWSVGLQVPSAVPQLCCMLCCCSVIFNLPEGYWKTIWLLVLGRIDRWSLNTLNVPPFEVSIVWYVELLSFVPSQ